jgi:hypothetical protein
MTDLRTVPAALLRQALEALESLFTLQADDARPKRCGDSIAALRAALEEQEQEQEPVAWRYQNSNTDHVYLVWEKGTGGRNWTPLYTHPPRREWQSLTEEEMHGLYRRAGLEAYYPRDGAVQYEYERRFDAYARAIEAKLKEKNA